MVDKIKRNAFKNLEKEVKNKTLLEQNKKELEAIYINQKQTLVDCFDGISQDTVINKKDVLQHPDHDIVIGILLAYSASTDLYSELNKAYRDKNYTYADSMGPYAYILYQIVKFGSNYRTDINHFFFFFPATLWRGTKLNKKQIGDHKTIFKSKGEKLLHMYGYISSSLEKGVGQSFMN